jgi:ABC-type phosphate transport system substrate-binding protein
MKTPLWILLLIVTSALGAPAETPAFVVIVNSVHPVTLTREQIADIFMKRLTRWSDGQPIAVVDALPESPVRAEFSRVILRRGVDAMEAYWQQQIFSGRDVPPVQKETDEKIVAFVSRKSGAIGYVAAGTPLGGLRAVTLRSEP